MPHMNPGLSYEIRHATKGLPAYQGGPAVDYTHAAVCYAASASVIHTPARKVLLVQRASGHGTIGEWSGVTGYIDTMRDSSGHASRRAQRKRSYYMPLVTRLIAV